MKKNISLAIILALAAAQPLLAQKAGKIIIPDSIPRNLKDERVKPNPLSNYSFIRLANQAFSYAILGESPVSGLKFETAKPKITLAGNLYISPEKSDILTLELSGGAKEGFMELFSKDKLSGEASGSITWHTRLGTTTGGIDQESKFKEFRKHQIEKIHNEVDKSVLDAVMLKALNEANFRATPSLDTLSAIYNRIKKNKPVQDLDSKKDYIKKMLAKYGTKEEDLDSGLKNFAGKLVSLHADDTTGTDHFTSEEALKLYADRKKADSTLKNHLNDYSDKEIEAFKHRYTYLSIRWLSVTLGAGNTSYKRFQPNQPTKPLASENAFEPRLKFAFNYLYKSQLKTNQYYHFIGAAQIRGTNSMADMASFDYRLSKPASDPDIPTIREEETGTAYTGELEPGVGIDLSVEGYLSPFAARFSPGLYLKLGFSWGDPWLNPRQIPAEIGILFSLPSAEKDNTNRLTVIPFGAWTNLNRSKKTAADIGYVALHEKFLVGVKVGVPINLGK